MQIDSETTYFIRLRKECCANHICVSKEINNLSRHEFNGGDRYSLRCIFVHNEDDLLPK